LVYYREGSEIPDPDYDHMFRVIGEEVATFRAADPGRSFWGLRLIWSTIRGQDPRSIIEDADNCIAAKIVWPDLVAGYDLAGPEYLGRPLADLLPELFWLRKQCAGEGIQLPFFLGAGECLGDGDITDGNLFDALLLGTRRIGNALSLYKHPRLIEAIRDKRILVEACLVDNVMHHPLPALLAQGVPCALFSDHPGNLSGQDGTAQMTDTLWQAVQAWDSMDLAGLGSLAENSVRWAAFEDQDAETWYVDSLSLLFNMELFCKCKQQWTPPYWCRFLVCAASLSPNSPGWPQGGGK
jgi:adenosine deaminase CECR1